MDDVETDAVDHGGVSSYVLGGSSATSVEGDSQEDRRRRALDAAMKRLGRDEGPQN